MKLKPKSVRGCNYRVTVCDTNGNYDYMDISSIDSVDWAARRIIECLLGRKQPEQKEVTQ